MNFIKKNLSFNISLLIFAIIVFFNLDFYKSLALILELIVIIEVVEMLFVFLNKQEVKIKNMIDISIIFFMREILIATTEQKEMKILYMYVGLIGVFFFFRYLSIKIIDIKKSD